MKAPYARRSLLSTGSLTGVEQPLLPTTQLERARSDCSGLAGRDSKVLLWRWNSEAFRAQAQMQKAPALTLSLAIKAVSVVMTVFLLGVVAAGQYHTYAAARAAAAAPPALPVRPDISQIGLPQQLTMQHLRQAGEAVAARFPGAANAPSPRAAAAAPGGAAGGAVAAAAAAAAAAGPAPFLPVDWEAVRRSCNPAANGTDGGERRVVLVTGAAGFIGMHVAIALRRRGDGVVGIDNFNDYYPVALKRARQLHAESAGVYTADGDINDAELLRRLFGECRFTHVAHMAAQAGVRYAARNPGAYVHANLAGAVALLEVAKDQTPPPAVVYASSSSVYGLNSKQPFSEADRVDAPASLYAATKRADELIAHVYHNIYGLSVTGLRFFTVYGPWGRPDMAAYKFAVALMRGDAIPVFQGPGRRELSRDFTYVDDVVAGVLGAVDTSTPSLKGAARYRLYNIGNTHPHSVSELVGLLERFMGRPARKRFLALPPAGDVLATYADVTAARADLGYDPRTPLEAGVKAFVDWFFRYYGTALDSGAARPADWAYRPV